MNKKKLISISQPTFLPWTGLFDLIDSVEKFIFLNDVQFVRRDWQQRNKIISNKVISWISLPVIKKDRSQLINETEIAKEFKYKNKLIKTIKNNYSKSKYYKNYIDEFENKFTECLKLKFLDDLNIELMKWFIEKIGIKTELFKSSDLNIAKKKSLKLIDICKSFNSSEYLSSYGSKDYLKSDFKLFQKENINVYLQNYETVYYNQLSNKFDRHVSILDMFFNEGPNTLELIRKGRKKKISLMEIK
jgi:hypothetical protein